MTLSVAAFRDQTTSIMPVVADGCLTEMLDALRELGPASSFERFGAALDKDWIERALDETNAASVRYYQSDWLMVIGSSWAMVIVRDSPRSALMFIGEVSLCSQQRWPSSLIPEETVRLRRRRARPRARARGCRVRRAFSCAVRQLEVRRLRSDRCREAIRVKPRGAWPSNRW